MSDLLRRSLNWLSRRVNGRNAHDDEPSRRPAAPHIIPRDQHNISRRNISDSALKVMSRLNSGGFEAYLVGGSVRDLLLGKRPKDFDVATDATPEEVRELFRNSRIIGRRFRIVHVRFGREIIEVTTFRARHEASVSQGRPTNHRSARSASGMLLRDNVFGSIEEDAARRDFTINAFYYTTRDFSVYDYANGLRDLELRCVRMIGDPELRYREDPVRMLRAIRFAGKLGFDIEPDTAAPIATLAPLLRDVAAARLFDEILKLLMAGHGVDTWRLLCRYGLAEILFPGTHAAIQAGTPLADELIVNALLNTDQRIREEKPVTPAFLYAALLWPALRMEMARLMAEEGMDEVPALQHAAQRVIDQQLPITTIPRRFSQPMREIWELQLRLPRRSGKRTHELVEHPRFRAGYDFVLLREQAGEDLGGLGRWWTDYIGGDDGQRQTMVEAAGRGGSGNPRRRRQKPRYRNTPKA